MIDPRIREDDLAITDTLLRQFAAICFAFFGGLAFYNGLIVGRIGAATFLGVLAVSTGIVGVLRPRTIDPIFRAAMAIAMPIGWVVSKVLLGAVFYLALTPIAVLFRLIKRDALARRLNPDAKSHWIAREQTTDPKRYWYQS
jgi:polyferredoxin